MDHEIVIPVQTDENGNYVSHNLRPLQPTLNGLLRTKRQTKHFPSKLFYFIEGFGKQFNLLLSHSTKFLGPLFKVYRRHKNGQLNKTAIEIPGREIRNCLYSGLVKHQEAASTVALNICKGLRGMIKTNDEEFLIEPLSEIDRDQQEAPMSHKLYRRSTVSHVAFSRGVVELPINHTNSVHHQAYYCGKKRRYMPHKPKTKQHWLPDEFPKPIRQKRALQSPEEFNLDRNRRRNVETLVVVDKDMVKKHGAENVTTYVLTVFNMVAMLYQDSSIGNNISVVLVGLVLLEGDEPGLSLSHNAEKSLSSFCQWQSTLEDTKGSHHDHAVLLTGLDICAWKDEPCDTLGYAPVSGMCSKYRSCTVNEDTGLALAFTVAHEVGHNFGMVHDGKGSKCTDARGSIMSPVLAGLDGTFKWTTCSRKELTNFLESSRSFCLNNEPQQKGDLQFPDTLPGEMYDADMQCKLQFGTKSKLCKLYHEKGKVLMKHDICKSLWCHRRGRECVTKFMPAAEGTSCGNNKWCRRGKCVEKNEEGPKPVDGGWGAFSDWTSCSKSCDGGIAYKERKCNNPRPRNGGKDCEGQTRVYKICNTELCHHANTDIRMEQCETFNNKTFRGNRFLWKPYEKDLGALSRCRVYCTPQKTEIFLVLSTKLPDGVACKPRFSAVCVEGECRNVGCDGVIDSTVNPDICGVCDGDNTTCHVVSGQETIYGNISGYYHIVKIPQKSRKIAVREVDESPSFLALRNVSGHYYITGHWTVDWPGRYLVAGTEFLYRRWYKKPESFQAEGPTNKDLIVEVLLQKKETTIHYEFVVNNNSTEPTHSVVSKPVRKRYEWRLIPSDCSVTCGRGHQYLNPRCVDDKGLLVDNEFCSAVLRPSADITRCNRDSCPARWEVGHWTRCTKGCGTGYQHRSVRCVQDKKTKGTRVVARRRCHGLTFPIRKQKCNEHKCPLSWVTGPWTKCQGGCNWGIQTRTVTCHESGLRNSPRVNPKECSQSVAPPSSRRCKNTDCRQFRLASDYDEWVTGNWLQCSATCGSGQQTRIVKCVRRENQLDSSDFKKIWNLRKGYNTAPKCDPQTRPAGVKPCNKQACKPTVPKGPNCFDLFSWCDIVVKHKVCGHQFYAKKCCNSCAKT
ncbi:A disintegrin and metalloproteinase with thrombospondin motifs 18-like isoform X2 [Tachypleus tridentatus]|uniref:A disintegrin and metalloproteinase with thrombospondin motifs 18-like isoform X2 n=1 Tax=Tachypleus tridentatus TaxID=6853 RepID=UPI003FD15AE4